MGKWQPIETAPLDGTPILVWDGFSMTTVTGHDVGMDRFKLVECGSYAESNEFDGATHWMPLPKPPK